jgi:hypothetical protein
MGTPISPSNWGESMEWKYTADEIMVKLNTTFFKISHPKMKT